ncbi:hypothetical protein ACFV6E_01125 [Streptomyces sp. NPDC059785]|uniref:hypothetical protein n=1 Tax=Streptomyces sp. NPDC059785 TaxID=3346945 RepID=UPI0036662F84
MIHTALHEPGLGRAATLGKACLKVFVVLTAWVSLPVAQQARDASMAQLSWGTDVFVLPMAALILATGFIDDAHGFEQVDLEQNVVHVTHAQGCAHLMRRGARRLQL